MSLTLYSQVLSTHAVQLHLNHQDLMAELRVLRQAEAGTLRLGVGSGVPNALVMPIRWVSNRWVG